MQSYYMSRYYEEYDKEFVFDVYHYISSSGFVIQRYILNQNAKSTKPHVKISIFELRSGKINFKKSENYANAKDRTWTRNSATNTQQRLL